MYWGTFSLIPLVGRLSETSESQFLLFEVLEYGEISSVLLSFSELN